MKENAILKEIHMKYIKSIQPFSHVDENIFWRANFSSNSCTKSDTKESKMYRKTFLHLLCFSPFKMYKHEILKAHAKARHKNQMLK